MIEWLLIGLFVSLVGLLLLGWCGTFDWCEVRILMYVLGGFVLAALVWPLTAAVLLIVLIMKGLGLWLPRRRR